MLTWRQTHYYGVYNQPNVRLISLQETPIERITERGITTSKEELEFDMIICATGFDAVTGSFDAIDIRGLNDAKLKDMWKTGPKTNLGMAVKDFPNM
jgi:cation diffusion facilitator CzcD-associated flavoprotein CzcO